MDDFGGFSSSTASMAASRGTASSTLPSNLHFSPYPVPRTPERPIRGGQSDMNGIQTTQARFRLKRRAGGRSISSNLFAPPSPSRDSSSVAGRPVPSIEIAGENNLAPLHISYQNYMQDDGYLSPMSSQPILDAPTTPSAQTTSFDGSSWSTAQQRALGDSIVRPMSQCSMWSGSSDDDNSSVASSYGTDCTSPDRVDGNHVFAVSKDQAASPPSFSFKHFDISAAAQSSTRSKNKMRWTPAMDDHLWTAYQFHLQDPTTTPIKTLPGNAPPLGVCHRVARSAQRTWREPRLRASVARFSTPQPPKAADADTRRDPLTSGDADDARNKITATWPKLPATRRRLRKLAKTRASIAPHYMRMVVGRTPSPFSSSVAASSRHNSQAPSSDSRQRLGEYPDRLHKNHVRTGFLLNPPETMRLNAPLARLHRTTPQMSPEPVSMPAPVPSLFSFNDPALPFASPAAEAPNMSRAASLDHIMTDAFTDTPMGLGSPFVPVASATWAAPGRQPGRAVMPEINRNQRESVLRPLTRPSTGSGSRPLRSPIQLTSSFPYNRSLGKRRAEHSLVDVPPPRQAQHVSHRRPQLNITELFGAPEHEHEQASEQDPSRDGACSPVQQRRVRLRGFSLGDALTQNQQDSQSAINLGLFPPTGDDPFIDTSNTSRLLGSPFRPADSSNSSARPHRFKVRHLPHNSLDSYPQNMFESIAARLDPEHVQ